MPEIRGTYKRFLDSVAKSVGDILGPQGWPNMRGQSFCCLVSIVDEAGGYDDPSLCCYRSATPEKPPTKGATESVFDKPAFL